MPSAANAFDTPRREPARRERHFERLQALRLETRRMKNEACAKLGLDPEPDED
jgi:hypothetical protein